jgi:hypothetical protein
VDVLDHEQTGAGGREAVDEVEEDGEGAVAALLGCERQRRHAVARRNCEQCGQHAKGFVITQRGVKAAERQQVFATLVHPVARGDGRSPLKSVADRIEGVVGLQRGALDGDMMSTGCLGEHGGMVSQLGLAKPGFAAKEQHDAVLGAGGIPGRLDGLELGGSSHDLAFGGLRERQPVVFNGSDDGEYLDRPVHALERWVAERHELETVPHQVLGRLADHKGSGLGDGLEPGRDVGRLTDKVGLFPKLPNRRVRDDRQAGVDADTHSQGRRVGSRAQAPDGLEHTETGEDRPGRVVLMCPWVPPTGHQPVAEGVVQPTPERLDRRNRLHLVAS